MVLWEHIMNASHVRQNFSSFIDGVVRDRPAVVRRNRDHFAALSVEHIHLVLECYRFTVNVVQEADGSVTGSLHEVDLVANTPDVDQLKAALAADLVDYAKEYMENFAQYFHSSNRRGHLPYVLRVLLQPDVSAVAALLSV